MKETYVAVGSNKLDVNISNSKDIKYTVLSERARNRTRHSTQCHLHELKIIPSEKQYVYSRIHTTY